MTAGAADRTRTVAVMRGDGPGRRPPWQRHGLTVRSQGHLGAWRDRWDELVLQAALPSPFLRSWWLEHTAQADPCFVLVTDGEALLGGMALEADRVLGVPRFRVLGHGRLVPDHLDAVIDPEHREAAIDALTAWCRRPGSRLFDLVGVVAGSAFQEILPDPVVSEQVGHCRYLRLPDEPEGVVPRMSGTERSSVKRGRKKLIKAGVSYRRVPAEHNEAALQRLYELHDRRWGADSGFLDLFAPFAAAAREGLVRDEVRLHELSLEGRVVAVLVDLHLDGRAFTFQDGRDPDPSLPSVGNVLQAYAMEDACREGAREYDFLRGGQPYKRGFTDRSRPVVRLRAARGAAGAATLALLAARERAGEAKGRTRRSLVARRANAAARFHELRSSGDRDPR